MKNFITRLNLAIFAISTLALTTNGFSSNLPNEEDEFVRLAKEELQACGEILKERGDGDVALLRTDDRGIQVGAPEWQVGLLVKALTEACQLSNEASLLIDIEDGGVFEISTYVDRHDNGRRAVELRSIYMGTFYVLDDIGDLFTIVFHRAD